MTDEQFNTLAQWEDNFRTATTSKWARHPGRSALSTIHKIHQELSSGPIPKVNTFCQACVLGELRAVGKLYFDEKERREKKAETPKKAPKTAAESAEKVAANKETAPEKKPRKSKKKSENEEK